MTAGNITQAWTFGAQASFLKKWYSLQRSVLIFDQLETWGTSRRAESLLKEMKAQDPSHRITAQQAVKHSYFKNQLQKRLITVRKQT